MPISRRKFLKLGATSIVWLGTSNLLHSYALEALPVKNKIRLRFAIASDGHYGQANTSYDQFHDEMVLWLNQEKENRGLHFSFINGDLFHDEPGLLIPVKKKWDQLKMPVYYAHGNHDKVTEEQWKETFRYPWHYSFKQGNSSFLVLNTADAAGSYICPDLDWTKKELERHANAKQLFVFMHITPIKWTNGGIHCPELVQLFNNQKNLKAIFHGHDHDQDSMKQQGDTMYLFDGHVGGSWGVDYRGYRIVEVLKSGDVLTYQMNPVAGKKVNEHGLS